MKFLILLAIAGCLPSPKGLFNGPQPTRVHVAPAVVPLRLLDLKKFDGYRIGTVTAIGTDWRYDDPCSLPQRLNPALCDGTTTFLVSTDKGDVLWAFAPQNGNMPLAVGDAGVFLWKWQWVAQLGTCAQRRSLTGYCPANERVKTLLVLLPVAVADEVIAAWATR